VVVLERAHLLELLLHPPTALDGEGEQFLQVFLADLAVGVEDLHEPGDGPPHGLAVAGVEVAAK
jgi:hypothetical protein